MQITAGDLAEMVNGQLEGNPNEMIHAPSRIEFGEKGTISFLANLKYESFIYEAKASVYLVPKEFQAKKEIDATLIRVDDVYKTIALLLDKFDQKEFVAPSISSLAFVHNEAKLGKDLEVGPFAVIEKATIGDHCKIASNVFIEDGVEIGNHVQLLSGVRVLNKSKIGDYSIVHSNSVIGAEGFGYLPNEEGYDRITHVGNVVIEKNVEIGANCVIDRATMGATRIGEGAKIDNLVQIAHNVEIGANTIISAQAGIAGSTQIGDWCVLGGQSGISGHIKIGDRVKIQAKSGVAGNHEEGKLLAGNPAFEYNKYARSSVVIRNLPELLDRVNQLEKQIENLKKKQ